MAKKLTKKTAEQLFAKVLGTKSNIENQSNDYRERYTITAGMMYAGCMYNRDRTHIVVDVCDNLYYVRGVICFDPETLEIDHEYTESYNDRGGSFKNEDLD